MNRSKSLPGQPVSITTAVQRFNERKYGEGGNMNLNDRIKETYPSGGKKLSPVVSESTRRRQKFPKQAQSRDRKNKESRIANKSPGDDIPTITRELTFFLPNSWDFDDKLSRNQRDILQRPEPVANSTIHVTEEEINVSRKHDVTHPNYIAAFKF